MIETKALSVNNFSSGISDFSINAPQNSAKKMDNLIVQKNGTLKAREGFSEAVRKLDKRKSDGLINFLDQNLIYLRRGVRADSQNSPLGISTGDSDYDIWNEQVFTTGFNGVRKSFKNSDGKFKTIRAGIPEAPYTKILGDFVEFNAGDGGETIELPNVRGDHSYIVAMGYEYRYKVGNLEFLDQGPLIQFRVDRFNLTREVLGEDPVTIERFISVDYPLQVVFLNGNVRFSDTPRDSVQVFDSKYIKDNPYDKEIGFLKSAEDFNLFPENPEDFKLVFYRTLDGDNVLRRIKEFTETEIQEIKRSKIYYAFISDVPDVTPEQTTIDKIKNLRDFNQVAYTTGGVPNNDAPPDAKYMNIVNNRAYYANFNRTRTTREILFGDFGVVLTTTEETVTEKNLIRQSQENDPDSVPGSFNVDLKEEITGLSSIKEIPIAFCKNKIYRLEGFFDRIGRGLIRPVEIDDTAGCVSHKSIVRVNDTLFWCGNDGIYRTNGYKVQKITQHLDETYQKDLAFMEDSLIQATYDAKRERVYFSFADEKTDEKYVNLFTKLWVLNLNFPISERSSFQQIVFKRGKVLLEDYQNYRSIEKERETNITMYKGDLHHEVTESKIIARHKDNDFTDYNYGKIFETYSFGLSKNINLESNTLPIIYNYEGFSTNFGTDQLRKWVPRADISLDLETNIDLEFNTKSDNSDVLRKMQPLRQGGDFMWGNPSFKWGNPQFKWRGIKRSVVKTRRMKTPGLRLSYMSTNFTNAKKVSVSSDLIGAKCLVNLRTITSREAFHLGVFDFDRPSADINAGKAFNVYEITLLENRKFIESEVLGGFLSLGDRANQIIQPSRRKKRVLDKSLNLLEAPIYSVKIDIVFQDDTSVKLERFSKDLSTIWIREEDFNFPGVSAGTDISYVFSIRQIPKGQRLNLLGYTIHYAPISMSNHTFVSGQNAGVKP